MPAAQLNAQPNYAMNVLEMAQGGLRNVNDTLSIQGYGVIHVLAESFAVTTASLDDVNDILRLFKFPPGAYLWFLRVTASDMDTNATPTLTFSILTTNDSDATQGTHISASTIGQAGGTAILTNASIGDFVGSMWLALKTTAAAATPAAGTLKVAVGFSIGVLNSTNGLKPTLTDVAV
jgi:hypothetical protein